MRGLEKPVTGKRITNVVQSSKKLRVPFPKNLRDIAGQKITHLSRRAKYILMHLSGGQVLIIHLGMSGRMTVNPDQAGKHDHFALELHDGTRIVFNDARRFGLIALADEKSLGVHKFFAHLGPEPFDAAFGSAYLQENFRDKKVAVKLAIMDQRLVVGVGNIYASEALHMARISPMRAAGKIKPAEATALARAVRAVLKKAIAAGGSSLRDYVQADGELGYFQHRWAVYGKAGEKCRACKAVIEKTVQGGRSTFYCPQCQK